MKSKYSKTVEISGAVIAFTMAKSSDGSVEIYYRVHSSLNQNPNEDTSWRDPEKLTFPTEIYALGSELVTVKMDEPAPTAEFDFSVVTDSAYIYVFRASTNETIYFDKFIYDQTLGKVVNATQVRYRRSRKADLPLDRKDSFGFRDMNDRLFLEPTVELTFTAGLWRGRFAVAIVPTQLAGVTRWQLVMQEAQSKKIRSYSILRTSNGGFDISDSMNPVTGEIQVDATFDLVDDSGAVLDLSSGPSLARYDRQAWQSDEYGKVTLQKRDIRFMVAVAAGPKQEIAILDFGVGNDGKLTRVGNTLQVSEAAVVQSALRFDPSVASMVTIPKIATGSNITVETWIAPSTHADGAAAIVTSSDGEDVAFTLGLDCGIPYFLGPDGNTVAGTEAVSVHDWTHIAVVWDTRANLYINGTPHSNSNGVVGKRGTVPAQGYHLGGAKGITGDLCALRLWKVARSQDQLVADMSRVLSSRDPQWGDLVGYWQANEPQDDSRLTTLPNLASTGASANGVLYEAVWVSSRAPTTTTGVPVEYDINGLTISTCRLPYATTTEAPCLYEGADSLVHLYYTAKDQAQASAAHFSPVVSYGIYAGLWEAKDADDPGNSQSGAVEFQARLPSTAMNTGTTGDPFIVIAPDKKKSFLKATLTSYTGYTETWPMVPSDLDSFTKIINGLASQLSKDPVAVDDETLMYDYTKVVVTNAGGERGPKPGPGTGSALFRVLVNELPDNGRPPIVQPIDTSTPARLSRAGTGGRWLPYAPLLGYEPTSLGHFVQVLPTADMDDYSGSLVLDRDLTIEAWISPIANENEKEMTLVAFNKPGGGTGAHETQVQYILGLKDGQPYAGKNEISSMAAEKVPLGGGWSHLAASYRANYGVRLGGRRYLDAGANENTKSAEAVTAESWVYLDALGTRQTVLAKTSPQEGKSWELMVEPDGTVAFNVNQATQTGSVERKVQSTTKLSTGKWHHVAGVYDVAFERQVALSFDSGDYVKLPEVSLPPTTGVSVMMWVKRINKGSGQQLLFSSLDPQRDLSFFLGLNNGVPYFKVTIGGKNYNAAGTSVLRADDWVHVAATFSAERGAAVIIDGILEGTDEASATPRFADRDARMVPKDFDAAYSVGGFAAQQTFIGTINELSLWNRGLDLNEVRQKIVEPLAATESGLSGYWKFNDLFGETAMDLAGTANGMLSGGNFIRIDKGAFAQKVFVDGTVEVFDRVVDPIALSESRVTLGSGYFENYLQATISESRLWNQGRMNWQIQHFGDRALSPNARGLVSNWTFRSGKGRVVFDKKSDNNARIVDGKVDLTDEVIEAMWVVATFKGSWTFHLDGTELSSAATPLPPGGYGAPQATIGAFYLQSTLSRFYTGQISQLRIWNKELNGSQIRSQMYTRLSGKEAGLAAFWPMGEGAGDLVADRSGWGNTGTWSDDSIPERAALDVPVGIEDAAIRSEPGDIAKPGNLKTPYAPSVGRYGQTQMDMDGNLDASLMQTLSLVDSEDEAFVQFADFKIGNLILQFVGQVQIDPTLIGYIEGAPPLPAENLKLYPGDPTSYIGASTLSIDETNIKAYTYAATRDVGTVVDVNTRMGFGVEGETSVGLVVEQKVLSYSVAAGLAAQVNETWSVLGEGTATEELTTTAVKSIDSRGAWHANDYRIDDGVGDIFYPNNTGYALVRSGTADLYAMRIEGSGTLVGYSAQPNPDIPEDMNIIMFKIDDQYVKNGTLDGWIGFQPDKSYPNLQPGDHASYFKPIEAYAIKSTIEREQQQRKAYFERFDAQSIGQREDALKPYGLDIADTNQSLVNALIGVKDKEKLAVEDWREKMARRSMVNTYVWTAEGGQYAEQQQFMAVREESSGGSYTMMTQAGLYTELALSPGPTFNLDAMFGTTITTTAHKTDHDSALFTMDVSLFGDQNYIGLVKKDADGELVYTNEPSPGKVRGYRFMSFYRAPSKQNFESFKDGIVDRDWLYGQGDYAGTYNPDALALRSAMSNPNEVWRVMHRVTYVSRTPPTTQNEGQSLSPDVRKPDEPSVLANLAMIALLPTNLEDRNPMAKVSEEADHLIAQLGQNPTWGPNLLAKKIEYKEDIMKYMRSYYGISE